MALWKTDAFFGGSGRKESGTIRRENRMVRLKGKYGFMKKRMLFGGSGRKAAEPLSREKEAVWFDWEVWG